MSELYIPPDTYTLEHAYSSQVRLGIYGRPGSGKTWAALTFPNPVVLNLDNKLGAHLGRKDVTVVPLNDPEYIWNVLKVSNEPYKYGRHSTNNPKLPSNRRDAVIKWLSEHGAKLIPEQTLILDSWTSLQNSFHEQQDLEPAYTAQNKVNDFHPWMEKIKYSARVCKLLEGLKCNVVVTFHEHAERDIKSGELLDSFQPLMQGKFIAELAGHFTDFFRARVIPKFNVKKEQVVINAPPGGDYAIQEDREFFWQIRQDVESESQTTSLTKVGNFKYIKATYEEFCKWR